MHAYATDATDRMKVPITIGVVAVGVSFLIYLLCKSIHVNFPWWVDVPGPVGIGMLALIVYDRVAWRWRLGPFVFSQIPDLGGVWEGTLKSNYADAPGPHSGRLLVTQRWSMIQIRFEPDGESSKSHSTMAAVNTVESAEPCLVYEYLNEPRALAAKTMAIHRGVARMSLESEDVLIGDYYNGRGRSTGGEMKFRRLGRGSRAAIASIAHRT